MPECFLIEPSETETKEAMDDFIDAMAKILEEANTNPETVTEAPFTQPVRRLNEVKAAKELDLVGVSDGAVSRVSELLLFEGCFL